MSYDALFETGVVEPIEHLHELLRCKLVLGETALRLVMRVDEVFLGLSPVSKIVDRLVQV